MSTSYDKDALRRLREKRGLLLPELASLAGLAPNTVNYIERGVTAPRADTLAKLATALNVDVSKFFIRAA